MVKERLNVSLNFGNIKMSSVAREQIGQNEVTKSAGVGFSEKDVEMIF